MTSAVIEIKNVYKSFGATLAVEDVSLQVNKNDFMGIIGPNGGGKTVLLRLVLGLLKPDKGSITVLGKSPQKARGAIGYVPQFAQFDHRFPISVLDAVLTGRLGKKGIGRRLGTDDYDKANGALKQVELSGLHDKQIGKLSGGQLQRVMIARALASDPKVLLLDEPTASLDPEVGNNVYGLLRELSKRMAIVLVTHDVGVISSFVSSVACINRQLSYHPTGDMPRELIENAYTCKVHYPIHTADCECQHKLEVK